MRRGFATIGVVVLVALAAVAPAGARDYESSFGFGISVPDVWLVLTRGEVAENADIFLETGESGVLASVPSEMRRVVYERIQRGELEIFYRREGNSGSFIDNVNLMLQPARLPNTHEQLTGLCQLLPDEFSRVFGRPVLMDGCEMRDLVGRAALYLQFDGAIPGTTTLQYQLQQSHDTTLVITATSTNANLSRMLGEFEQIVASIRLR